MPPHPSHEPSLCPHIPCLTHSDILLFHREISVSGDILRMNEMYISISVSSLVCAVSLVEVFQYSSALAGRFQLNTEATDNHTALVNHGRCCDDSGMSIQVETLTILAVSSSCDITAALPDRATVHCLDCASPLPITNSDTTTPNKSLQAELREGAETGYVTAKPSSHCHSGILTQNLDWVKMT